MIIKFIILSLTLVSLSTGLEWTDEDAIYITAQKNSPGLRVGNSTSTIEPPLVTAIPVEIVLGQCVKASTCYPILFYSKDQLAKQDQDQEEQQIVVDINLYKFILSTASYCEPSDLPPQVLDKEGRSELPSDDVYIWCPIRSFPTTRPEAVLSLGKNNGKVNGTAETEEESSTTPLPDVECGPVKANANNEDDDFAKLRVVGGMDANLNEFPHMVAFTNNGKHFCSGTLIDERHVLLAAHCLSHLRRKDLKNIRALIGDHNIRDPTDVVHQERNVSAVIFHANFSMRTVKSDIGLAYLSQPVIFGEGVAPICLPDGKNSPPPFDDGSVYGTLTGWGQIGENKTASPTLMKTRLRIWRHEECAEKYKGLIPGGSITSSMLCASSVAPVLRDACKGDSGGPLSLVRNNRVEQIGIVSFGIGCGKWPGVFTRVTDFIDWIEKHKMKSSTYFGNNS